MTMANPSPGIGSDDLHISDVIDVIEHDSEYTGRSSFNTAMDTSNLRQMTSSVATLRNIDHSMMNSVPMGDPELEAKKRAFVKILEQPASKALRFRYECEGRSAGSIPGANSTVDNKTYPTIQVVGYRGRAVVVVSCVTKDPPYRPHPHSLVGKEGCKKGVCTLEINNESMICSFSNLGIQCVKKKGVEEALKLREEIRVDPFHTGFGHRSQPQNIDLNAVRLCFQVFLEGSQKGKFTFPLKPIVSDPIYDKKAMCDLTICKLSDCSSSVSGGKEIILLCDKITKDDVQLRFYEERDGHVVWEGFGEFQASDVHKQVAISFRTPRYKNLETEVPVQTYIQLRRPSDGASSEPRPFQYLPLDSGSIVGRDDESQIMMSPSSVPAIGKRIKPNFQLYSNILAVDAALLARQMFGCEPQARVSPKKEVASVAVQCEDSNQVEVAKEPVRVVAKSEEQQVAQPPKVESSQSVYAKVRKPDRPLKCVAFENRASLSTIASESDDARFSLVSSEDLNARLSAAFSEYSDVTDLNSVYSEADINEILSLASSTHTLNDRLSQLSEDDVSDSDVTVVDRNSDTCSIDTIEKQLEMLQSMSVDHHDAQTYSSFQMAMKNPVIKWPVATKPPAPVAIEEDPAVYDDPAEQPPPPPPPTIPQVPPRIESMSGGKTPPLPPRRFKKFNQPLPDPPVKEPGLRGALQVLRQTLGIRQKSPSKNPQESAAEAPAKEAEAPGAEVDATGTQLPSEADLWLDADGANLTEAENYALYMRLAPLATASEFDDAETLSVLYAELNAIREAAKNQENPVKSN